jgi:sugar O-acyltransferase (sialic acid O-acetyltransferase NeuD family)
MAELLIFGTAEIASLARFYFEHDTEHRVVAFTVDDAFVQEPTLERLPVVPWSEAVARFPPSRHPMHVALSYRGLNGLRQAKFDQAVAAGYTLVSYVCSRSVTWPGLAIGRNCFILENQTIQPTVRIGDNVMLWSGNHIGHGTHIADHAYLASHVVVSGHCRIGPRAFIGVNATIRDFATIGARAFIAMGALVTRDVADDAVVLGADGTILPPDDRRARVLRKSFFGEVP